MLLLPTCTLKYKRMELRGKVAYITGGSKGIGYGIAEALLKQGMKVAIGGRNREGVADAVARLKVHGEVLGLRSDVSRAAEEVDAVNSILEAWGQLDVVMANAGLAHFAPIDELGLDQWHQ